MEPHATIAVWHEDGGHALRLQPGRHRRQEHGGEGVRPRARPGAGHLAARGRRLRLQGHAAAARDRLGHGRAGGRAAGQAGGHPPADVRGHRLPHPDHPADAAGRRPRRAADRDLPRRDRPDLDRAGVRRAGRAPEPDDVRGAEPAHDASAGQAGRADAVVDARARRDAGHVRARVGDGRAGHRVRDRPDRAARPQRPRSRSRERATASRAATSSPACARAPSASAGPSAIRARAPAATAAGWSAPASPRRPTRLAASPPRPGRSYDPDGGYDDPDRRRRHRHRAPAPR